MLKSGLMIRIYGLLFSIFVCTQLQAQPYRLITLDPGHFHAALIQKKMLPLLDSTVKIFAPAGSDLQQHLSRIQGYNSRSIEPTRWVEQVYTGTDFEQQCFTGKQGDIIMLAGNNRNKTSYIGRSLQNGYHVFADKPMVITPEGFTALEAAFNQAKEKNLLLYDIMTERFEITSMLQRELASIPEIFGKLKKGSAAQPAVVMHSVHHFYKNVSGKPLIRPEWFMDTRQQGEGIVDVMTHLVDLVQWESFPDQIIRYPNDIRITAARHWTTNMSLSQFSHITGATGFPEFLKQSLLNDTLLGIYCNGEINYTLKGIAVQTRVTWNYEAPAGSGDTHYSLLRGTKADLEIRQGPEENYKPVLYIRPIQNTKAFGFALEKAIALLRKKYPGIALETTTGGWKVLIPQALQEDHEAHFSRVTENFLNYLKAGKLPDWEVPNMLAKYYTTTTALSLCK